MADLQPGLHEHHGSNPTMWIRFFGHCCGVKLPHMLPTTSGSISSSEGSSYGAAWAKIMAAPPQGGLSKRPLKQSVNAIGQVKTNTHINK